MAKVKEKAPAYQWYVNDWRGSRTVQRMTWAQRGMYREMLDEQWDKGSLPDDPRAVSDLLGGPETEWLDAWPILRRNFVDRRARGGSLNPDDHDPNRRILNVRLEKHRKQYRAYLAERSKSGRKGGLAKSKKDSELNGKLSQSLAIARELQPSELQPSSSTSSSTSSSSSSSTSTSSSTSKDLIRVVSR